MGGAHNNLVITSKVCNVCVFCECVDDSIWCALCWLNYDVLCTWIPFYQNFFAKDNSKINEKNVTVKHRFAKRHTYLLSRPYILL